MTPVALPQLAVARISGADAAAFLHGQLSADIATLEDGAATFACYCSPRGQVYGLLLVCRGENEFRLVADADLLPDMLGRLRMYVLRAQVELEVVDDVSVWALPAAEPSTGQGQVFQPVGLDLQYRLAPAASPVPVSTAFWKERELRRNVVWLGPRTTERFIPQMLGLDRIGAVSFRKGCYPGQEIIARAHYLGQVKRKPLLLQLTGSPELAPGAPLQLLDGQEWLQGTVVDSVLLDSGSETEETLLLAVSPVPDHAIAEAEYGGVRYRCATI